ncbi:MAG: metal-dependent transcriptional regulator [Bacteroidetes bacterium]|nr:metal-dependent transcriptional regulator [Bacteroidota bacterium]
MKTTSAEENYLKAVLKFDHGEEPVNTNTLAAELGTTPASVTDMLKKLGEKGLLHYTPYRGASLTTEGRTRALHILRKHRLWETFLVEKLKFGWDEVHDAAEQLEHIDNPLLVNKLDEFLGYPTYDPHGEPIPDANGQMANRPKIPLAQAPLQQRMEVAGVVIDDADFLRHLDRFGIRPGTHLLVQEHISYDESIIVEVAGHQHLLSAFVARNVYVWC